MWKIRQKEWYIWKCSHCFKKLFTRYPHFVDNFMLTMIFVDDCEKKKAKKFRNYLTLLGLANIMDNDVFRHIENFLPIYQ